MKRKLSKKDIVKYLKLINEELVKAEETAEIVLLGGCAMVLMYDARKSTKDIDAIFNNKSKMRECVKMIAKNNNLNDDWLNDAAKSFITPKMKTVEVTKFSNLKIKVFDLESLLVLKLISARALTNDFSDSLILLENSSIKNIEELYELVEKYAPEDLLTPRVDYFIQEVWKKYRGDENK